MQPLPSVTRSQSPDAGQCGVRITRLPIHRLLAALMTLLVMLALKRHYSQADVDQLVWMLAPIARLIGWLTGACPVYEQRVGYVDFAQGIIIAPACAGINFMIMAFGLAAFCGLLSIRRPCALFCWLALSLAGAYGLALAANTLRIALSMGLYQAGIHAGWLTPQRLHRLLGVFLYLSVLGAFFMGLQPLLGCFARRFDKHSRPAQSALPAWLPLGWYLLGALGVPAANRFFQGYSPAFAEHSLTLVVAGVCLFSLVTLMGRLLKRVLLDKIGLFRRKSCLKGMTQPTFR
jgi:exosortase K